MNKGEKPEDGQHERGAEDGKNKRGTNHFSALHF
jgi:hypothetical protein